MGYFSALDFAQHASLETAVGWHFSANCFPPISGACVAPAVRAIRLARRGRWDARVRMPEGVRHRVYGQFVPTHACIKGWRLDAFVDAGE